MNIAQIDSAVLTAIAEEAGAKILEIYRDEKSIEVLEKADKSPLTAADKAGHEIIAARLAEYYPEIPVLSEEGRDIPFEERKNWRLNWCVDPLDGTKEFIKRNGEFTVNIALIEDGKPVFGVIHAPDLDMTAWGSVSGGAWIRDREQPVRRLDYVAPANASPRFVVSRSHMSEEVQKYLERWPNPECKSSGSSLKFMLLAKGEAEIYPRLAPTMEWDTAAGQAILEACGGQVIDQETGKPMVYNRENLRNAHFIAVANGVTEY